MTSSFQNQDCILKDNTENSWSSAWQPANAKRDPGRDTSMSSAPSHGNISPVSIISSPSLLRATTQASVVPDIRHHFGRDRVLLPVTELPAASTPNQLCGPPAYIYSISDSSSLPRGLPAAPLLFQNFSGPVSLPDIYEGDTGKWDSHFSTIQTAYKELGKDADFVIRVLTEDFTLPFPYVWGEDDDAGELTQSSQNDPSEEDCWDFFMQPGKPMPRSLQPLHATTQAYFKKRRMEQTAVSFATLSGPLSSAQGSPGAQSSFVMIAEALPAESFPASPMVPVQTDVKVVQLPSNSWVTPTLTPHQSNRSSTGEHS
ncbi:uncharacterized protein C8orf90 homolog [Ascaphus truei]|uniref:uncharacterized protein C8orf90 homolog n=1 Tax=Ascaphus truei TaxID=8439 RepID=UPI003F5A4BBA